MNRPADVSSEDDVVDPVAAAVVVGDERVRNERLGA
jgi:hypothetical protein